MSSGGSGGGGFVPRDAGVADGGRDAAAATPDATQCTAETHDVRIVPLDLFFMMDISGSMSEVVGGRTKWVEVREALVAFLKDGRSAGLGVALHFFPPPAKPCTAATDCTGILGDQCALRGVCTANGLPGQDIRTCNAATTTICPAAGLGMSTLPCVPAGQCAKTGQYCTVMGQPCPGGLADDLCNPWPRICTGTPASLCDPGFYANPTVTFADLPGNEPKLTAALMDVVPMSSTPTAPAVQGALSHLRRRAMADTSRKPVLVLATDGLPQGCTPDNNVMGAADQLAQGFMGQAGAPSVPTYVIGVLSPPEIPQTNAGLMQLASAGGTGMPFLLTAGQDLGPRLIDSLNAIRGQALGCEFMIPAPRMGPLDVKKVNVRWTGPGGTTDPSYVGSAGRCDANRGGWYYDVDPARGTPTRVRLCESTCKQVKANDQTRVELLFGCMTKV